MHDDLQLISVYDMCEDFFVNNYIKQIRKSNISADELFGARLHGSHLKGDPYELYYKYRDLRDTFFAGNSNGNSYNSNEIRIVSAEVNDGHDILIPVEYFAVYKGNILIGLINFRLKLNTTAFLDGGNIEFCILPQYRNKGYGKILLTLLINFIKSKYKNYPCVVIDCINIQSEKIVKSCGGVLLHDLIYIGKVNFKKQKRYVLPLLRQ